MLGRAMTEGPFLGVLREHEERAVRGDPAAAQVLVQTATRAVVGLAHTAPDPQWPGCTTVDVHCHPAFAEHGAALLARVTPTAGRCVAYADVGWQWKEDLLARAGYRRIGVLSGWLAADAAQSRFVDVGVWQRPRSSIPR